MIEVAINTVDGVKFIENLRILEPDKTYMGVPVHIIPEGTDPEFLLAIKAMGLRKVGVAEFCFQQDLYAQGRLSFIRVILNRFLFRIYWASIKFLYKHAGFFRQIPPSDRFSWSYFTPYCWYLSVKRRLNAHL